MPTKINLFKFLFGILNKITIIANPNVIKNKVNK